VEMTEAAAQQLVAATPASLRKGLDACHAK
jgi:hypothetical protein